MKITNFPQLVFGFILLLSSTQLSAQILRQKVILINSQPVLVDIDEKGNVTKVVKQEPKALEGYENDFATTDSLPKFPTSEVYDGGKPPMIYTDLAQDKHRKSELQDYAIVSYKIADAVDATLAFEANFATLSDSSITDLDRIANLLKSNRSDVVVIRTLSLTGKDDLSINRLSAAKEYLRFKGIDGARIIGENLYGKINSNDVKLHIIKEFLK